MHLIFLLTCFSLCADLHHLESESRLYRSTQWINQLTEQISRTSPPSAVRQTDSLLSQASVWFTVQQDRVTTPFLDQLAYLGVQALDIPLHGDYEKAAALIETKGLLLIGKPLAPLTTNGADFRLAIAAYKEYPHLFHLIEIEKSDWNFFPEGTLSTASIQRLRKKGYLQGASEKIYPYSAKSSWKATAPVVGDDQKERRWIYLVKEGVPALNWLDPSFLSEKLSGGEVAHALLRLSQSILVFHSLENEIATPLALLTRKLGGWSALRTPTSLNKLKESPTDLFYDLFSPLALIHALITENAEALQAIYRTYLKENVSLSTFIHELPATHCFLCEWNTFLKNPKPSLYYEENLTGELLAQRLLNNDLRNLSRAPSQYSSPIAPLFGLCSETSNFRASKEQFKHAHLLLAFFYAMQPGVFSFSSEDLRGKGLYPLSSSQLNNKSSFSLRLKSFLEIRMKTNLAQASLLEVIPTKNRSLLLLLFRLPDHRIALTAINFSKDSLEEELLSPYLLNTWAIDLVKGLLEPKSFDSKILSLQLEGRSGKIFLLQTKSV